MKIEINTTEIKESLSNHSLSDLVLYLSWFFIHIGMFSNMNASDFFVLAGLVNFVCALGYKIIFKTINWKV
jgi:sorbitol-specific phosphotransferase system component IIC